MCAYIVIIISASNAEICGKCGHFHAFRAFDGFYQNGGVFAVYQRHKCTRTVDPANLHGSELTKMTYDIILGPRFREYHMKDMLTIRFR